MIGINLSQLIPDALQQKAIDATIDFVVGKGQDYLAGEALDKIKQMRSDWGFQKTFKDGLQRAIERFGREYSDQDEDLTVALTANNAMFENEEVQQALLKILKRPGVYQLPEQQLINQSFDSVLPNRRNRERVNQAVIFFLKCLAEEVWHLPELRPLYELQFQRMTAETLKEQVAIQKAQLQASVNLSADIRGALLQLTEAVSQQRLLSAPNQDLSNLPKLPRHNLPQPDYQRFVGRKEQLKRIRELLDPKHRAWVVTIDGIGGIGKSALALEIADSYRRHYDRLPAEERFEAIIWTTAKLTVLTGQGIITRSQSLRTLDDIYSTIAVVLQREDITRARPADQDEIVRQSLSQQRALLIVDNLETVDDERVMAFLRDVPAPTKVIVTTRHRLDVAYPVRVVGMGEEEALQLIADQAHLKELTLTTDQAKQLYARTGGVPLAMVWSVAQMGFGYGVETVLTRLGQPNNDVAKFCFEAAVERIKTKPAYKLLLALSLFATDASREALGFVADLPELDRDDGLVELEKLSLVNKEGDRFSLLPMTKGYAEGGKNYEIQKCYIEYFVGFCQREIGTKYWDGINFNAKRIEPEMENLFLAFDWAFTSENWQAVQSIFIGVVHAMGLTPLSKKRINLAEKAIIAAEKLGDREMLAWLHIDALGYSLKSIGKLDEMLNHVKIGQLIAKESNLVDCLAAADIRLAQLAMKFDDSIATLKYIEKALSNAISPMTKFRAYRIQAEFYAQRQEWKKAIESLLIATKITSDENDYPDEASAQSDLGNIYLEIGDLNSAEKAFLRVQMVAKEHGWSNKFAGSLLGLAKVSYNCGAIDLARNYAEQARGIYEQIGRTNKAREVNDFLTMQGN